MPTSRVEAPRARCANRARSVTAAVDRWIQAQQRRPASDAELEELLDRAGVAPESLLDPWERQLHPVIEPDGHWSRLRFVSAGGDGEFTLSAECKAFAEDPQADIGEIIKAGCQPTTGQMSALMDNPLGNVAMPWAMESTRRHYLIYAQFVVFHIGVTAARPNNWSLG